MSTDRSTLVDWAQLGYVKESLYIGEPMRQQKNLVILGYRVDFD